MTFTVKIPKRFIDDHAARALIVDADNNEIAFDTVVVRTLKKHYVVTLTEAQAYELLSDAHFYVDGGVREFGWEMGGLIASARATYDALVKAGV